MKAILLVVGMTVAAMVGNDAERSGAIFTRKPVARRVEHGARIEFAVDRETDVTVWIEDENGKIVRRLASGVLGPNPPYPLKPGLSQSLLWDGKADWGRPAPPGPFRVHVALGISVRYDSEVIADPLSIGKVLAIAVGPDGTLYAVVAAGTTVPNWLAQRVVALNRDGSFQRTLIPPPSTVTREQIEALGGVPVEIGGRIVPMVVHVNQRRNTAFRMRARAGQITVSHSGWLVFVHENEALGLLDTSGTATPPSLVGPRLLPAIPMASFKTLNPYEPEKTYVLCSADRKTAYFSGLASKATPYGDKNRVTPPYPAVFRVKLPERSPAEVFFGELETTGKDERHLGGMPRGMDVDGKGNLFVCDSANDRVVVIDEATGRYVASFPAQGVEFVAVDRNTGAVYLLRPDPKQSKAELLKLASWQDPRPVASLTLTTPVWPPRGLVWQMAVDVNADPVVVWIANDTSPLLRLEDLGNEFSEPRKIEGRDIGDASFVGLTVDHFRDDPEIYARIVCGSYNYQFVRFNEKTEHVDVVKLKGVHHPAAGSCIEVGPDGNIYAQGWDAYLYKFNRHGNPLAWERPFAPPPGVTVPGGKLPTHAIFSRVIMVYMTHTLGVRHDGHLFIFEGHPTAGKNGTHALFEYEASGAGGPGPGRHPIIWGASDSVVGPRFDQEGNIYVAEQIRPLAQLIPPEFESLTGPVTLGTGWPAHDPRAAVAQMYGSIVKFGPKGGFFDIAFYKRRDDEPTPDPAWKSVEAASWIGQVHDRFSPAGITGALWVHMGIGQISLHYCNCENTRFDVDPFGRVWYPDLGRYRVGVLDSNGNLMLTFGGYGNAESRGPDSPLIDPATGKTKPRSAGHALLLKSPFAEPEIAFAWLVGVGATDKYVYMGDSLNRRLLRARVVYAAEETCELK